MIKHFSSAALLLALALTATTASAHTGAHDIDGFISGLSHPFLGLDHLLVMLGVGLWASRLTRLNASLTIAAFLSFMVCGAGLALSGLNIQGVETGILASVLIVGLLLSVSRRFPVLLTIGLLAGFAVLHGVAHGLEMPLAAAPVDYAVGFLLATASLHGIGLGLGAMLNQHRFGLRVSGYITSGLGLYLLLNA
ncbi:MAG: HupE/UreJ family protein [Methylovulum sp.]|uniref:HupE/UreJ family protein n=1 Tax=Methylovulum sp. TaxID=1916980 RepID=UPI0026220C58|nr:HupE/UreJ family protein [Methylovulum sp.]MDD2724415.1 HupE/UreJ family protein [Methylovulum sp.]MDD5124000.1 HupE/UreJ family protein [Methylovulum sp.]